MNRLFIIIATAVFTYSAALPESTPAHSPSSLADITWPVDRSNPLEREQDSEGSHAAACCKVCTRGKACADTCIVSSRTLFPQLDIRFWPILLKNSVFDLVREISAR
jgi:hypothetical protein